MEHFPEGALRLDEQRARSELQAIASSPTEPIVGTMTDVEQPRRASGEPSGRRTARHKRKHVARRTLDHQHGSEVAWIGLDQPAVMSRKRAKQRRVANRMTLANLTGPLIQVPTKHQSPAMGKLRPEGSTAQAGRC